EGTDKKVLVIDNHDDFGGHAKRNEFKVDGQELIGYGGSQSLESPGQYSKQAAQLLRDVGIEVDRFYDYFDRDYFQRQGLGPAIYFSREEYGKDQTLPNVMGDFTGKFDSTDLMKVIERYPISDESKASLAALLQSEEDYLAGMSNSNKIELLRSISYTDFLRDHIGVTEEVITIVRDRVNSYWGFGLDALSALEGWRMDQPGTFGLDLKLDQDSLWSSEEPYIFHFPDGNAGVARALVRALIPDALPGTTMSELTLGKVDYSRLDHASSGARVRLNSTAVDVRHTPDQSHVDVTYIRNGKPERVRGKHVVMACYNSIIPHIVPEVSADQREAIEYAQKTPLVYISVAIRNWRAMAELGCNNIYIPKPSLMYSVGLDFPVSVGDYSYTPSPDHPAVLHGTFLPTTPDQGLTQKEQNHLGQKRIFGMSFNDYESQVIRQLDGALGRAGFDVERDIAALTVNRWPHGYAYEYNDLFDPREYGPENGPHIAGRAQIGRISIANSDSSAYAYVDGAIDAAYRAVQEQIGL
ncbi:MAG: twin-arginine translocation pathway signal, partial [Woeseiaceae bacterium]|nr:twin-arginine translocation pathway signal [Woeseiaceae bacterium]